MSWEGAKIWIGCGHGYAHVDIAPKLRGAEEDQRARKIDTIKTTCWWG